MTDYDAVFARLRGLKWGLAVLAAACFVLGCALFVSPAWGYADYARLQQVLSWFAIAAGALSLIGAFASGSEFVLTGAEPVMSGVLLLAGLATLLFPFAAFSFVPVCAALGIFLAFYILACALEMDRRGLGNWVAELIVALAVLIVSLANLFGVAGTAGMLGLSALEFYVAAWGFVYGAVVLSEPAVAVA